MLSAGLVLAVGLVAPPSDPPPKPAAYELSWTAPEACPSADAIRERVDALAAQASGGHGTMFVGATVSPRVSGYSLELKTEHEGRKDTRTVEATTCDELGESTALLVAISLHPVLAEGETSPDDPSEPETPRATIVEPQTAAAPPEPLPPESRPKLEAVADPTKPSDAAPRATTAQPRERRRLAPRLVAIRVAPGIEVGALPGPGGASHAALSLVWNRLRLELVGTYLWPRRGNSDPPGLYQAGFVGARACAQPGPPRIKFPLCLGIEGGTLRADSRGLDPQRAVHGPWLGVTGSGGVAIGGERLGFWSAAELVAAAVRTRVLVDEDVSFGGFPVSFRLLAGLEIFLSIDSPGAGHRR